MLSTTSILIALIATFFSIKWKITTAALIYYMELKGYTLPNKTEMEICTQKVIKHTINDLKHQ